MAKVDKPIPSVSELEAMTPQELSELFKSIVLLLRRFPDVPLSALEKVQVVDSGPQPHQDEPYTPDASDEALYANLLTTQVVQAIQQEYADQHITDLAAYNRLYDVARRADVQARKLLSKLDGQENEGSNQ